VRALVDLLPDIDVIEGDNYNSDPADPSLMGPEARDAYTAGATPRTSQRRIPMVEVPLGATEDRICGTIDIERALSDGVKAFEPGLLAKANRGILFVDEVNLLDDSLVDVVLDSAASGWNTVRNAARLKQSPADASRPRQVEREGISILHPAKFIMIGSGNPEEGELRPQLLDRFGMAVTVATIYDLEARIDLVQNRLAYEKDPEAFQASCTKETEELRQKLEAARSRVASVKISRELTLKISEVCSLINVDGLRGDIVVNRTAKALAALEGVEEVTQLHIARVIPLCLGHRLRKDPLDPIDSGSKVVMAYQRVFNPKKKAEAPADGAAPPAAAAPVPAGAKPAAAPAKPAAPEKPKKAGAWGGLGR
jgi:magnesium chelatase subunit I